MIKASPKQRIYLNNSVESNVIYNVAEGTVRSAKTTLNVAAFLIGLEQSAEKLHLCLGAKANTAKVIFREKFIQLLNAGLVTFGKYMEFSCCYIFDKVILFCGGSTVSDWEKFHGFDIGMILATEFDTFHENTIAEMQARIVASKQKKVFIDLNPTNPDHTCYTGYIDEWCKRTDCNYSHFSFDDNLSLTEEDKEYARNMYPEGSVFHKRFVLGLRARAEGVIYNSFAEDTERYVITNVQEYLKRTRQSIGLVAVGVDWGHNGSANAAVAVGITRNYKEAIVLDEFHTTDLLDPKTLYKKLCEFLQGVVSKYGPCYVYADNAEGMLVRGLRNTVIEKGIQASVKECYKHPITDRIILENFMFSFNRIKVLQTCTHIINSFCSAVWDKKQNKDVRLDDGTISIDPLDAFEYAICMIMKQLEKAGHLMVKDGNSRGNFSRQGSY